MLDYRTYLIAASLIASVALAGCGSSSGDDPTDVNPGNPVTESAVELFAAGNHTGPMNGNCLTCHANEGEALLKTSTTVNNDIVTASAEYNLCTSCHSVASHQNYAFDPAAANSCSQCHDPHAGSKFAQSFAGDITLEWSQSGHGDSDSMAFTYDFSDSCLECHSGAVFAKQVSGKAADRIITDGGGQVIACGACHDLQARNEQNDFELGALHRIDAVTFPSEATVSIDAANNLCLECHQGRSSTPTVDALIAATPTGEEFSFSNIHYAAAGAVLFGSEVQGGYEYEGRDYSARNGFEIHALAGVPDLATCTGCHMAAEHSFDVHLATCQTCHPGGDSFETLGSIVDGSDGAISINYTRINAFKDQLKDLLTDSGVTKLDGYPYFSGITTEVQLKAAYNLQFAEKDKGGYIHNGLYLRQLLYDSIVDMGEEPIYSTP